MKWINYAKAGSVQEAVDILKEGNARPLAGGTDLLVNLRVRKTDVNIVVDVKDIEELNEISCSATDGLTLGAAVPCYRVYNHGGIIAHYSGLIDAASIIGGTQIQGRASIGGNLCNAAPSADVVPALIALEAVANIAGPGGSRQVAVEDFCTGPSQSVLQTGELLVSLHFPFPAKGSGAQYMRFIPRNEMDIAVAGAGVSVELDNGTFKSARIALASVAPTPLFVKEAGEALAGKPVNDESIRMASAIAKDAAKPITDMRGTIEYRKHLCEVLTRRGLNIAIDRAKENK